MDAKAGRTLFTHVGIAKGSVRAARCRQKGLRERNSVEAAILLLSKRQQLLKLISACQGGDVDQVACRSPAEERQNLVSGQLVRMQHRATASWTSGRSRPSNAISTAVVRRSPVVTCS